jgi:uncharacterized protein YlxW (UPF0749 family)
MAGKIRESMIHGWTKLMGSAMGAVVFSVALSACRPVPIATAPPKSDPVVDLSGKVQSLQKQVQERDKRIEELEAQLDALKLIDQDREKQRKPLRAPTSVEPFQ